MSTMYLKQGRRARRRGRKAKSAGKSFQIVMKKTPIKDWAFRWYLDVGDFLDVTGAGAPDVFATMRIDKVIGVGGTGGYQDNVYARKTYIYTPKAAYGITRLFKEGGAAPLKEMNAS